VSAEGHLPFTARGKKVIELSLREALQLGHSYIGTEHILLGLIALGVILYLFSNRSLA
jgi:ATP-dependent Clp protease ATP-binding subunit ClpC